MKNVIILGTLLFCVGSVRADDIPPIKPSHIFKLTPPAIQKATPKGATILETASFPIGSKGSDIYLHLYADAPTLFPASDVVGASADGKPDLGLGPRIRPKVVNGKVPLAVSGRLEMFVSRGGRFVRIQSLNFKRPDGDEDYLFGTPSIVSKLGSRSE